MSIARFPASLLLVAALTAGPFPLYAQSYPTKPIRILTSEPGGGTDLTARIIAPGLTVGLGQPVVIENRNALIGIELAAKAPADGYTLLLNGPAIWLTQFMRDNVPWDPIKDLAPITLAVSVPNLVVVHPSLPVKSVRELVALAKSRPGELNYGSGPAGAPPHLAGELFKALAKVNIAAIPYRGSGLAITALIGGQVQLMFPSVGSVVPHVKSGRLRALAVTSAQPSELLPGLPTVAASGVPGYEMVGIYGVFAPASTTASIIQRLNQEFVRVLHQPEIRQRFLNDSVEAVGNSPEQLASTMKADLVKMGKLIKDIGIHE